MRILILSNYYPPLSVGGYEIACEQAVAGLQARGHELRVLTSRWRAAEISPETESATDSKTASKTEVLRSLAQIDYQNGGFRQKWQTERENYALTRDQLRHWQPDLVYVWNLRLVSLGPLYALQDTRLPRVFELGDFWPDAYLKPGLLPWIKRSAKQLLPGCHGGPLRLDPVISVAGWMQPEIEQKYQSRQVHVIPNGVPLPPRRLPDWSQPLKALFIGRLDPEKGLHLAIEALGRLREQGLILPLSVAGSGDADYTAHCLDLCRQHGIMSQVDFLGWQQDPTALYHQHQLLLMPTLMREPFGLVIVEAMLRGLAVFAPAAYGPAEILTQGRTGYLFRPGDSADLADCLSRALARPDELAAVGRQASAQARTRFDLDKRLDRVEQVLQAVAA